MYSWVDGCMDVSMHAHGWIDINMVIAWYIFDRILITEQCSCFAQMFDDRQWSEGCMISPLLG